MTTTPSVTTPIPSWQGELEQRLRALPSVKYAGETHAGGKIFKANGYRVVIPRGGERAVRLSVTRNVEHFVKQAQRAEGHEFGTRPSDVELMRPIVPVDAKIDETVAEVHRNGFELRPAGVPVTETAPPTDNVVSTP